MAVTSYIGGGGYNHRQFEQLGEAMAKSVHGNHPGRSTCFREEYQG